MRVVQIVEGHHAGVGSRGGAGQDPPAADDWPALALGLQLECAIWTEDQDFFGIGVATWTRPRSIAVTGIWADLGASVERRWVTYAQQAARERRTQVKRGI